MTEVGYLLIKFLHFGDVNFILGIRPSRVPVN